MCSNVVVAALRGNDVPERLPECGESTSHLDTDLKREPATAVMMARAQPWHRGHHDLLRRIVLRDWLAIVPSRQDLDWLLQRNIVRTVVALVDITDPRKSNPLTIGERRYLIEVAIRNDSELSMAYSRGELRVDHLGSDPCVRLCVSALRFILPEHDPIVILTDNAAGYHDARDSGVKSIYIKNRENVVDQSATRIRELIANGDVEGVRTRLPTGVFAAMNERHLFDRIAQISRG